MTAPGQSEWLKGIAVLRDLLLDRERPLIAGPLGFNLWRVDAVIDLCADEDTEVRGLALHTWKHCNRTEEMRTAIRRLERHSRASSNDPGWGPEFREQVRAAKGTRDLWRALPDPSVMLPRKHLSLRYALSFHPDGELCFLVRGGTAVLRHPRWRCPSLGTQTVGHVTVTTVQLAVSAGLARIGCWELPRADVLGLGETIKGRPVLEVASGSQVHYTYKEDGHTKAVECGDKLVNGGRL